MISTIAKLLNKYDHAADKDGVSAIYDEWESNKHTLYELLSKHPNWNSARMAVVLPADWTRPADPLEIDNFMRWVKNGFTDREHDALYTVWQCTRAIVEALDAESALVNDELAAAINAIHADVKVVPGQKVSRAINKLCNKLGLTENPSYNRRYAMFADACGVHKTKKTTLISINPMDYLTMSFGNGWKSCHTIDRYNHRGGSGQDFSGCHCSGTLSYMMDEASVICFTLRSEDDIADYEADKIDRCMFHVSNDGTAFIQGRVYPQCNDSRDNGLYGQYRSLFQNIMADCLRVPSLWTLKKGKRECENVSETTGTHYPDYTIFGHCSVSRLKNAHTDENKPVKIRIGHNPICPNCGDEHYEENQLCCEYCEDGCVAYCDECGRGIREDDHDYICIDDRSFCCADCAEEAGYRWCKDVCEYRHGNDCYCDDYTGEYFAYTDEMIETEDGSIFRDWVNAENAGYACTYDGEWYRVDDVFYCAHCDKDVYISDWNAEHGCCYLCAAEIEEAEREAAELEGMETIAA